MQKALILKFFLFSILSASGATAQFDSQQQQPDSQQQTDRSQGSLPIPRPSTGVSISNGGMNGAGVSAADRELLREEQQAQQDAAEEKQRIAQQEAEIRNLPPEPDIEFQYFVAGTLGYPLQIFGHDLFHNTPSTFAPLDRVPVTPDYLIGPGDELVIHAWGQIDVNFRATVDRTGSIYIPKVGAISVAGVRYEQLEDHLRAAVSRVYKNFNLTVTLGRLRSIQVFMVGQVRRPGSYTVSSLSTLVNALFASGGVSKRGSMRNIVLKRQGKEITRFDLYDLIVRGDKSKDVQLLPGDVIYVPPVGNLVALAGSVNVPAIFELKDHETLDDVLAYAGGLTTTASGQKVYVDRIDEHQNRRTAEFALDASGLKTPLRDGDIVRFLHISPRFDNAITLRGNVAVPGRYPWHQGMRVKDLIPNREFLITETFWNRQNVLGINQNNTGFQSPEQQSAVQAAEQQKAAAQQQQAAARAGQPNPPAPPPPPQPPQTPVLPSSQQPDTTGLSRAEAQRVTEEALKNQVKRSAAEINWEYAVIQRMNPDDLTTHLLPFNLGKAIAGEEQQNLLLEPGDIVTIFSQADMQVPIGQQSKFVRLEGEFQSAGVYQVQPGETLRQLIRRIGGFTSQAYLYGAEFTRESVREDQQARLDQYVNELDKSIEQNAGAQRGLSPDEALAEHQALEGQRALVEKLRQLRATGRIVLELKPTASSLDQIPDLVLEDGDRLLVPFRPATVNVIGAVYNTNSFIYKPGKTFGDYLRLSGGATRNGDKGRSFVIRADGTTVSRYGHSSLFFNNFDSTRLMAGDTIVVPEKLDKGVVLRGFKDWTTIISQFVLGAAAAKVLFP